MENKLNLSTLFANPNIFLGQKVTLDAVLVVKGGECYLVPSFESRDRNFDDPHRVEIYSPGLEKRLTQLVDFFIGGLVGYFDTVEITGRLEKGTTVKNAFSISSPESLVLFRDGKIYKIIP